MRYKWFCLFCSLLPFAVSSTVVNNYTLIRINGNILPNSCTLVQDKSTQDINLGTYANNTLTTVGKTLTAKTVKVYLTGCNSGIMGTVVTLSGSADKDSPTLLALSNPDADETAKGIAIQLSDSSDNIIPVNGKSLQQKLVAGNNTLTFKLAYQVTKVPVTAGIANSVLYFDMAYQ